MGISAFLGIIYTHFASSKVPVYTNICMHIYPVVVVAFNPEMSYAHIKLVAFNSRISYAHILC